MFFSVYHKGTQKANSVFYRKEKRQKSSIKAADTYVSAALVPYETLYHRNQQHLVCIQGAL